MQSKQPSQEQSSLTNGKFRFICGLDQSYSKEKRSFVLQRHFREKNKLKTITKPTPSHAKRKKSRNATFCMKCIRILTLDERKNAQLCASCQEDVIYRQTSTELYNVQEQRGWRFFREQAAYRIGMSDQDFWVCLIFQLGETHLSIRHLLIALGGMYESWATGFTNLESSRRTDSPMGFGLVQCNKAIKLLTTADDSSLSAAVILTSCLLFASFQNSQNHCENAFRHFESGLRILHRYHASKRSDASSTEDELIHHYLEPIFESHRSKPTTGRASNPAAKFTYERVKCRLFKLEIPEEFRHIRLARNTLHILMDLAVSCIEALLSSENPNLIEQILQHSQKLLQAWRESFERLILRINSTLLIAVQDPCFPKQNTRLHIHHRVCNIVLLTIPFDDEMLFDAHLQDFRDIVTIAREYLRQEEPVELSDGEGLMPCFSFGSGLMMPLFLVACRCRDPTVRREAVRVLLKIENLKEGFWESQVLAICAQRVIEIEERDYVYHEYSRQLHSLKPGGRSGTKVAAEDRIRLSAIIFDPNNHQISSPMVMTGDEDSMTSSSFISSAIISAISPTMHSLGNTTGSPGSHLNSYGTPQSFMQAQSRYILYFTRPAVNPLNTSFAGVEYAPIVSADSIALRQGSEVIRAPWRVTFIVHNGNKYVWERYFGKLEYFSFYDRPVAKAACPLDHINQYDYTSFEDSDGEWIYMGESVQSSWWQSIEDKI